MKVLFVISALVSIASAGVGPIVIIPSTSQLLRSPPLDSAIVQSEQLGGNFAYAIAEGQSFQTVSPLVAINLRAIDSLGVSYAINPYPILNQYPATILLHSQPTSEAEQREQQAARDLLQRQQDELQEALDHQREEEGRQLQDQIDQQQQINQQALEQQKQLIELQQQWQHDQQNLVGNGVVTVPVAVAQSPSVPVVVGQSPYVPVVAEPSPSVPAPAPVVPLEPSNNGQSSQEQENNTSLNDDSVVVENTSLTKSDDTQANDEQQQQEEPSDQSAEIKSDYN